MLVLARKQGEALILSNGIRIDVVVVKGKWVKLGINAPANILVLREELVERKAKESAEHGSERKRETA